MYYHHNEWKSRDGRTDIDCVWMSESRLLVNTRDYWLTRIVHYERVRQLHYFFINSQ